LTRATPGLRILGEADVRAAIDSNVALELARRTLRDQAAGRSILSSASAMMLDGRSLGGPRFFFKAAAVGHMGVSGIRLMAHPGPTSSASYNHCALYSHDDGMLSGLVSEHWLSRIRAAAFGAATIERLVNPGQLVVALFGAGGIAAEIVPMLSSALSICELRVHSRRAESSSRFVAAHARSVPFRMLAEPDREAAVRGADLIVTLTESSTPVVSAGNLKRGAVVCSMGAHNELDYGVLQDAQRLVVDDAEFAAKVGDGAAWISQGHLSRQQFEKRVDALACEVVSGVKPGRLTPDDRVVALVQGMAIGDIAFAAHALGEAEKSGRGKVVELP
jgi:ornithine cyclodeaminase